MGAAAAGTVTIGFAGEAQQGAWALRDGVLTVTHPLGRRRVPLLDSAPEELAEPLLLDILRQASFPPQPKDRGAIYGEVATFTTAIAFLASWAWLGWLFGWWGVLLGWLPAIFIGGLSGIVWPVAIPVALLWLAWPWLL
jgi:hypothetical protein